jgi:hypothetical protein
MDKSKEYDNLWKEMKADEKAGYPPKCNPGYEPSEDGKKCVKIAKAWNKKKY